MRSIIVVLEDKLRKHDTPISFFFLFFCLGSESAHFVFQKLFPVILIFIKKQQKKTSLRTNPTVDLEINRVPSRIGRSRRMKRAQSRSYVAALGI